MLKMRMMIFVTGGSTVQYQGGSDDAAAEGAGSH